MSKQDGSECREHNGPTADAQHDESAGPVVRVEGPVNASAGIAALIGLLLLACGGWNTISLDPSLLQARVAAAAPG